jgi:hypothetical protein
MNQAAGEHPALQVNNIGGEPYCSGRAAKTIIVLCNWSTNIYNFLIFKYKKGYFYNGRV